MIRDVIKDYVVMPNISVPTRAPKMKLSSIQLFPQTTILSDLSRSRLGRPKIYSTNPLTFERIDQYSGFVLYETSLPRFSLDPSVLSIPNINDRAIVLVDDVSTLIIIAMITLNYSFEANC